MQPAKVASARGALGDAINESTQAKEGTPGEATLCMPTKESFGELTFPPESCAQVAVRDREQSVTDSD